MHDIVCMYTNPWNILWQFVHGKYTFLVDSDDGLPPEAEGVARLAETLQAHMWPTITMKGRDPTTLETQPIPTSDGSRSTEQVSEISKDSSTSMDGKNASTVTGSLEELESKAATPGNKEEYQKRVGKRN